MRRCSRLAGNLQSLFPLSISRVLAMELGRGAAFDEEFLWLARYPYGGSFALQNHFSQNNQIFMSMEHFTVRAAPIYH